MYVCMYVTRCFCI